MLIVDRMKELKEEYQGVLARMELIKSYYVLGYREVDENDDPVPIADNVVNMAEYIK